ncbi:MAG: ATP-dependent helicase, Rep family [Acidobacteriales bacterium]|nr:ATP-dependent helicase, Rep family [Terriglobales bacterium]
MNQLLEKLNPQQREAAETVYGPLLILAGAGSGKTRVITYRIAHLVENMGKPADSILAVTFTNKAAAEMGERVSKLIAGRSLAQPTLSTFHSFCVRVLRRDIETLRIGDSGFKRDFAIYDESDQQAIIKQAMKRLGIDDKQLKPRAVLSQISWAKSHMLDPQEVYLRSADPKTERVAHIYEIYRQELRKANALDFDDLLLETVRLLKSNAEVREKYNRRYEFILIDEYQDTNRPQYELVKLLGAGHQNVCVVGDEDQSIYSWRGADIKNILEFEKDFPNAKVIRLEQNYRSTQNILEAASAVVAHNQQRKGKNLWTARQGGGKIGYYEAPDGENESLFVADYISKYMKMAMRDNGANEDPPRAAVLYRTNSQSRLFEEALRRYGLKYNVVGGFSFYERAEIKDMISYLKLVNNLDDSIALMRVVNTPARGIGKTTMETIERIALETGLTLWASIGHAVKEKLLQPRACLALKNFKEIIEEARAMLFGNFTEQLTASIATEDDTSFGPPTLASQVDEVEDTAFGFGKLAFDDHEPEMIRAEASGPKQDAEESDEVAEAVPGFRAPASAATLPEALKFLIDRTGYIKALEEEATPEALSRIENLQELVNAARDSRDRGETLEEFLDHAALVSDVDQYDAGANITLMTLHAAKGLEFPLVCLVGLEEGLFPHSRTLMDPDGLEEERRLCYVGMTRAMDALIVSRARYRRRYGNDMPEASIPSRFLEEIPPHLFQDLGGSKRQSSTPLPSYDYGDAQYSYEDEDQSANKYAQQQAARTKPKSSFTGGNTYNSVDNIAEFFASRGKKFNSPIAQSKAEAPKGGRAFRPGQKVRHPKYGEGTVYKREGEGDSAKITVQFPRFGLKKLVEKYAQLEKVSS